MPTGVVPGVDGGAASDSGADDSATATNGPSTDGSVLEENAVSLPAVARSSGSTGGTGGADDDEADAPPPPSTPTPARQAEAESGLVPLAVHAAIEVQLVDILTYWSKSFHVHVTSIVCEHALDRNGRLHLLSIPDLQSYSTVRARLCARRPAHSARAFSMTRPPHARTYSPIGACVRAIACDRVRHVPDTADGAACVRCS